MRPLLRLFGGGTALAAACVAWGAGFERTWYSLRHVTVPVLRPGAGAPLRLLHVSDLHLLPSHARLRKFLDGCARTAPDLVVATGDLIGSPDVIDDAVDLLAGLRGDRPGLAVLGSNDRYAPQPRNPLRYLFAPARRPANALLDTGRLVRGLEAAGYELVDNRRTCVRGPAGDIDVLGLGDPHIGRDRPEHLDWSASGDVALRLGVVHAPYLRVLDRYADNDVDLVLAGHTHGGQVRLPVIGAVADNCDLPRRQARGLSRHRGTWLHVSAGLGHSRYAPYRFACRPEATVLDLVPAEPGTGESPRSKVQTRHWRGDTHRTR